MRCRTASLARIIGALLVMAILASCSAIRLAYNNLPELSYWWLDGYVDFDGTQTPMVRNRLAELLAWHRREELPKVAALLRQAQGMAPADATPAQACALVDGVRERLLAVAAQAEPALTELALSLSAVQLQNLERKYAKVNAEYRKDWLSLSPAALQEKRYDQFLERNEDFYGTLDAAQRERLQQMVVQSRFDPRIQDAQRRRQQQETLALLRRFQAEKTPPAEARAAIHAMSQRIAEPPPGPWRDYQLAMQEEGCRNLAVLHNLTRADQRAAAVKRLRTYEADLRTLSESPGD